MKYEMYKGNKNKKINVLLLNSSSEIVLSHTKESGFLFQKFLKFHFHHFHTTCNLICGENNVSEADLIHCWFCNIKNNVMAE